MSSVLNIVILVNTILFVLLSLIHIYWLFGGQLGIDKAIPKKENGEYSFWPGKAMTLAVAVGLLFFAFITFSFIKFGNYSIEFPFKIYAMWFIVIIFYLRSVGDFKHIGFFKKTKNTVFSKYDTKIYNPLSVYIATSSLFIMVIS